MQPSSTNVGIFGKLPAHGDFIDRGLPSSFISIWDEWLQRCLSSSQSRLGNQWLDHYLVSPIWRFVLTNGVIDGNQYIGIIIPSVDSVGRYFPLTIAHKINTTENPFRVLSEPAWYQHAENIAINALTNRENIDEMFRNLQGVKPNVKIDSRANYQTQRGQYSFLSIDAYTFTDLYSELLFKSKSNEMPAFSLWHQNNQNESHKYFESSGLPSPDVYTMMISGSW
jgi:type VI secretion system protein ImpM